MKNSGLPTSQAMMDLHDRLLSTHGWPDASLVINTDLLWRAITVNHLNNCLLWAEEDLARRTKVSDSEIAANKRRIDAFNQARNDATETVDELLLMALQPAQTGRLNSETAGSMMDRLSILSLKISAMRAQSWRQDVDQAHRQTSEIKLARLLQQRLDLGHCLDELLTDCQAGKAYFKVYRQFKMYNDPQLNPALVAEAAA
jgi:Protein of unknown function (DUF4254)